MAIHFQNLLSIPNCISLFFPFQPIVRILLKLPIRMRQLHFIILLAMELILILWLCMMNTIVLFIQTRTPMIIKMVSFLGFYSVKSFGWLKVHFYIYYELGSKLKGSEFSLDHVICPHRSVVDLPPIMIPEQAKDQVLKQHIDLSRHDFENCLLSWFSPQNCLSRASSSDGKIMEQDKFQNYGGKDFPL